MYDHVETTVRNLKSLDIDAATYGAFLVPLLSRKLPQEMKKIMSRHFKEKIWNFTELMQIYKEELETQERISLETSSSYNEGEFSTANLHVQNRNNRGTKQNQKFGPTSQQGKGPNCLYCGANHATTNCPNVTDVQNRRSILRKKGTCFVCFQKGHISRRCNQDYQCHKCGGRHHVTLCDGGTGVAPGQSTSKTTPNRNGNLQLQPNTPQFVPNTNQNFTQIPWLMSADPSFGPPAVCTPVCATGSNVLSECSILPVQSWCDGFPSSSPDATSRP